jgi:hypothetical protein
VVRENEDYDDSTNTADMKPRRKQMIIHQVTKRWAEA